MSLIENDQIPLRCIEQTLDSRRPFPAWAKAASLLACAAGLAWDIITLLQRPLSLTRYPFLMTVALNSF